MLSFLLYILDLLLLQRTPFFQADYFMKKNIELTSDEPVSGPHWYPGHMERAVREIKEKIKSVDIVFEIRDARAPLASGNILLEEILRQKSHLIILNKINLAHPAVILKWKEWFSKNSTPFLFLDCMDKGSIKKILEISKMIVNKKKERTHGKMRIMILGIPNTGKSTLINQLAKRSATKVADRPGQTKLQQLIVVSDELELLDTPGIIPPILETIEQRLWLSAINAIPDDIFGEEFSALFLINFFKEFHSLDFKKRYQLDSLDKPAEEILDCIAKVRGCIKKDGLLDLERAYKLILSDFRSGLLGKVCFEHPPQAN